MTKNKKISNLKDLCDFLGCDNKNVTASSLSHRLYKDTNCGASISLIGESGTGFHNGNRTVLDKAKLKGFTIQTIIEGSEATVDSDLFVFGIATVKDINEFIKYMEEEAQEIWEAANADDEEDRYIADV